MRVEPPEFVRLGKEPSVDAVFFGMIQNWRHLSQAEFARLDIADPAHPEHQEFLNVVESAELVDRLVMCGNVAPYRWREKEREARYNSSLATANGDGAQENHESS